MLKKGDPCYVRLHSGKIAKAKYIRPGSRKGHFVNVNGAIVFASNQITDDETAGIPDCRFVCMSGMRKEYVDSINN